MEQIIKTLARRFKYVEALGDTDPRGFRRGVKILLVEIKPHLEYISSAANLYKKSESAHAHLQMLENALDSVSLAEWENTPEKEKNAIYEQLEGAREDLNKSLTNILNLGSFLLWPEIEEGILYLDTISAEWLQNLDLILDGEADRKKTGKPGRHVVPIEEYFADLSRLDEVREDLRKYAPGAGLRDAIKAWQKKGVMRARENDLYPFPAWGTLAWFLGFPENDKKARNSYEQAKKNKK